MRGYAVLVSPGSFLSILFSVWFELSLIPLQRVQRDGQLEAAAQVSPADRGQEGLGAGGLVRSLHPRPRPRPQRLAQARPQARQAPLRPQVGATWTSLDRQRRVIATFHVRSVK